MRVPRLAAANVTALWRRFLGLAVLAAIGTGICLPLLAVAAEADTAVRARVTDGLVLRSIEIVRQDDRPDGAVITPASIAQISTISDVSSVEPSVQATIGIKTATIPGALLYATMPRPSILPPIVKSVRPRTFPLSGNEAVLPAQAQGMDLTPLLGTKVSIEYQQTVGVGEGRGAQDEITVVGIFDPGWQIDGADSAYVANGPLLKWASSVAAVPTGTFLDTHGYDKATVVARSSADVPRLLADLQHRGFSATSVQQQMTELPSVLRLIGLVSQALTGALVLFTLLGAWVLSGSLVRQRTREIGLLKAVGYRTRSVLAMFLLELVIVAVVAGAVGLVLGVVGGELLNRSLARSPDLSLYLNGQPLPPVGTLLLLVSIPAVAMAMGGLLPARRGARMEPSAALRDW
jgi:putative ABC transport system permease protein